MMLEVFSLAKSIAEKSPVAVQGTKRSLIYSRDHSVQEGLNHVVCIQPPPGLSGIILSSAGQSWIR